MLQDGGDVIFFTELAFAGVSRCTFYKLSCLRASSSVLSLRSQFILHLASQPAQNGGNS